MNCREAETLLLTDRALDEPRRSALVAHVAGCGSCRQVQADLAASALAWRAADAAVRPPTVETEWHAIRRRIRDGATSPARSSVGLPVWGWGLATAAAALVLAAVVGPRWTASPAATGERGWTYVSYVEVDDAAADAMVYEDPESGWLVVWVGEGGVTSGS